MSSNPTDNIWQRDEIESPCIKICLMHPAARLCMGCYRTGAEIAAWSRYSPAQRRTIMDDLPARAIQVDKTPMKRKGGRARAISREADRLTDSEIAPETRRKNPNLRTDT